MRTAAICPTCATYENALCVLYDGPYLSVLDISPMDSLQLALQNINSFVSTLQPALGFTPEDVANKVLSKADFISSATSIIKYPSVKAVRDFIVDGYQPILGFTPENVINKSTNIITDQTSNVKYPSVKAVFDFVQSSIPAVPYKSYIAYLIFDTGTVDATVIYNDLGDGSGDGINDIAWSLDGTFTALATMTDAPFLVSKTYVDPSMYSVGGVTFSFLSQRIDDTQLGFTSRRTDNNVQSVVFGEPIYVKITVYN